MKKSTVSLRKEHLFLGILDFSSAQRPMCYLCDSFPDKKKQGSLIWPTTFFGTTSRQTYICIMQIYLKNAPKNAQYFFF